MKSNEWMFKFIVQFIYYTELKYMGIKADSPKYRF